MRSAHTQENTQRYCKFSFNHDTILKIMIIEVFGSQTPKLPQKKMQWCTFRRRPWLELLQSFFGFVAQIQLVGGYAQLIFYLGW